MAGDVSPVAMFSSETMVTGSQNRVTYVTRVISVTLVHWSQGHVGHVVYFWGKFDSGSQGHAGHVDHAVFFSLQKRIF